MNTAPAVEPDLLHPAVWLAHQLGRSAPAGVPSGDDALDAELPGGGWPKRSLTELLLPRAGIGEIRLLVPALVEAQRQERLVMLFDPPALLAAWALAGFGLDVDRILVVRSRTDASTANDGLWALEQALKSGHVGAIVAWLPERMPAPRLRRLQLAASSHDGPAFAFREQRVASRPSPVPLRLVLAPGGGDRLLVRIVKRRGPPLEAELALELLPVLSGPARRIADAHARSVERPSPGSPHDPPRLREATFVDLS